MVTGIRDQRRHDRRRCVSCGTCIAVASVMGHTALLARSFGVVAMVFCALAAAGTARTASTRIFHDDDPLAREPETQDAAGVRKWTVDLFIDLAVNLFSQPGDSATGVRAANINTIDEVPDSNWFTNRILARPISVEEIVRAGRSDKVPAEGTWTIVGSKDEGVAPGFTVQDESGETWFISLDARGQPEAATAAVLVANRIFWALGYWQAEQVLTRVRPEQLAIDDRATIRPMSGVVRRMRRDDLDEVLARAHRSPDGSFRAVAARSIPGRPLGGFRYYGTRPDDPNDVVPHEHRRELRALRAFGAWTNLVDMKAGNTLDVLISENGRGVVRHYLQDVGSTFGTGATAPREFDEGWEHLYEGDLLWKRLASLNFVMPKWQTVDYETRPAVGRFEGTEFDPLTWRPRVPTAAFRHAQPDDVFWAARRVMAFSDEMIRAIVKAGEYSNAEDERHLAEVLIQRRNKIGATYLIAVNPLVNPQLSGDGCLSFENAAVTAGVAAAPGGGYRVEWARFDNETGSTTWIGHTTVESGDRACAPAPLVDTIGAFMRVRVHAIDPPYETWAQPIHVHFRRDAGGWRLVGINRGAL